MTRIKIENEVFFFGRLEVYFVWIVRIEPRHKCHKTDTVMVVVIIIVLVSCVTIRGKTVMRLERVLWPNFDKTATKSLYVQQTNI